MSLTCIDKSRRMGRCLLVLALFVWLVGFLMCSSTTRLYRGQTNVCQFYMLPHTTQSGGTMTSVSADPIILTPTQPVRSGRAQRGSNPGPLRQVLRALPTELPHLLWCWPTQVHLLQI